MAEIIREYKCPSCGGAIEFDSTSQKMKCPYCDTEFDVETLQKYDEMLKADKPDDIKWESKNPGFTIDEDTGLRSYICESCGGEIIGDDTLAATACPFCDSPAIMMNQFKGVLRPDYVIPFQLNKKAAKEAFLRHLTGKKLLPKAFKDENHIDEIKGVYVPFWLFDADADANLRFRATRVRSWSDSRYIYTETSFYELLRAGKIGFQRVPADGSSKMPDDLMESVEPFDFSKAVDFQTAYLSGYFAEIYDQDSDAVKPRANQRVKTSTENAFKKTATGYSTITVENSQVSIQDGSCLYALYPVWLLHTTWKGQKFLFAMNGQSGKFVGNLPLDKSAYRKYLFGFGALFSAIAFAVAVLLYFLM